MKRKHDPFIIFMTFLISVFTLMLIVNVSQSLPVQKPDFVTFSPSVERAYMFVKEQPENARYIPCYCGCDYMVHADEILQHESLKECFFRPNGSYEPHGANCELCYIIANNAADMLDEGKSIIETRNAIDMEYQGTGRTGTKTPMPQEGNK